MAITKQIYRSKLSSHTCAVKENTDCGATERNSTMIISLLRRIFEADDRDVDGDDAETS